MFFTDTFDEYWKGNAIMFFTDTSDEHWNNTHQMYQ
jgi:hypothetical protein